MRGRGYTGRRGRGRELYRDSENSPSASVTNHSAEVPPCELADFFRRAEGMNYGMLQELQGRLFDLPSDGLTLRFLCVQPDPFAPGSQVELSFPLPFDSCLIQGGSGEERGLRVVATEDYLLRSFTRLLARHHHSGALQALRPSQHVLPRSTVVVGPTRASLFLRVKLPGHGRRIDGRGALNILFHEIHPTLVQGVCNLNVNALRQHILCTLDQEWLRHQLLPASLVAFVADGAVLPRAAGDSDLPLENFVPFASPATLRRSFTLPHTGQTITGMGLPRGLTLIAGGGFHGKSTLLRALELGVYNHVPDDGRTFVVVDPSAVKIRAEDRRAVSGVDISPFITNLPQRQPTTSFCTLDASGSTSQAANIMEALELGSTCLVMDEDTSATNFLYRDTLMQQLVPANQEPITPFVERVRELIEKHGVSALMVVGGSGQYFPFADVVLVLNDYHVEDATARAKKVIADAAAGGWSPLSSATKNGSTPPSVAAEFILPPSRTMDYHGTFVSATARQGSHRSHGTKISGSGLDLVRVSDEDIRMGLVEQLVEEGQLNAIAQCLALLYDGGADTVREGQVEWVVKEPFQPPTLFAVPSSPAVTRFPQQWAPSPFARLVYNCERQLRVQQLEIQSRSCYLPRGFTSLPRVFEIGAALNRLRTLRAHA